MNIKTITFLFCYLVSISSVSSASIEEQQRNILSDTIENGTVEEVLNLIQNSENQEEMMMIAAWFDITSGNGEVLQSLLDLNEPLDINIVSQNGLTLLHDACEHDNVDALEILLSVEGIDVNIPDENGRTCIFSCIEDGHDLDCLKLLLQDDRVDFNQVDYEGKSILHEAVGSNFLEFSKEIIESGNLDINIQDDTGATALHYAVANNSVEISQLLFEANASTILTDNDGNTAKDIASSHNFIEILNLFEEMENRFEPPFLK